MSVGSLDLCSLYEPAVTRTAAKCVVEPKSETAVSAGSLFVPITHLGIDNRNSYSE